MEKKQRYCPSCGAKTNDAVCEICGRHTKPISERYHEKNLYIELMGKYANVILVDEDGRIIDALKRIPPFENNKRTILPNVM